MQLLFVVATGEAWAEYASMVALSSNQPESLVMIFFVVFVVWVFATIWVYLKTRRYRNHWDPAIFKRD